MIWKLELLKNISTVDWGNTNLTKSSFVKDGKYLAVSAAGIDGRINHFEHSEDTVVISAIGANCGVVFFPGEKFTAIKNTMIVKPNPEIVFGKYLFWYFTVNIFRRRGAGQPFLSKADTEIVEIPLPPLETQKRIADILDAADALRQKDQELLKKYDELAQAIFIDMFGDPVKNEKGFSQTKLGDCLNNIQIGPFGTQLHESDYVKNGIPVINPMHIGNLILKPNSNYTITEEKYNQLSQYHLKIDDVILGRRGEMGRCAIIDIKYGKCICGTGSLFLTVNKELLDPLFLVYVLSRKSTKIALENISAGTTMANLNKNIINDFEIILPNIKLQQSFVKAVKLTEMSIKHSLTTLSQSDIFFNSLLQKAFKGELI